ncbi:DNA gyrase inhibitor YacG [Rhodopseudomonas sp. NSM]|uniref:DNA gyrase inhibitor YacG n=1 Tax=Rhodopseudomonas sp. NSM TaxID=3457630 RepID=UPI00403515DC
MPPDAPADRSGAGKSAAAKRCPVCGKPATAESRPFCSERCRDVDLNRWLSGAYKIPAAPADDDEDN